MPRTKANLKSRKVNLRATRVRTRKNIKHTNFLSRKERIAQAAIAGAIIQEQVLALQAAGVIPAAAGAAAVAPNPLDQVLNLDQGLAVLHGAADQAADPVPLHRQINAQLGPSPRRRGGVRRLHRIRPALRHADQTRSASHRTRRNCRRAQRCFHPDFLHRRNQKRKPRRSDRRRRATHCRCVCLAAGRRHRVRGARSSRPFFRIVATVLLFRR